MKVIADLCVVPMGIGVSVSREVAVCERILADAGLKTALHAYGTNTKEQQIEFGEVKSGEVISVTFSFECWLGIDEYSISLATHSPEGEAYDWLDAALFLKVTNRSLTEGIANLHASVIDTSRVAGGEAQSTTAANVADRESVTYGGR